MTNSEIRLTRNEVIHPILLALALTVLAEIIYLVVWGMLLFPQGSFSSKFVWTMTCGIGMGSVIGVATLLLVVGRFTGWRAVFLASLIMILVGTICSILCSQLDETFNYFGGREHRSLFLWAGFIPSIFGGPLYGWLLFSSRGRKLLGRA